MPGPSPATTPGTDDPSPRVGRWAWGLCWLMFASTALNYMDRQAIALVSPQVRRVFAIDFEGFGWVLTAFALSYALFQVPAGFLVDRFDTRRVYAGAVAFWSFAAILTAFAPALGALIALRALLGAGESFNWPCALKVTGAILPPKDRSLGNGIFNSGAAVGAVLTPLAVPLLAALYGWRTAFVAIGSLGFVWVAAWLAATRGRLGAGIRAGEAAVGGGPSGAARRGMTRRARVGFGLVGALALGIVAAGYARPAPLAVPLEALRPDGPATLDAWLVAPNEAVKRGKTDLARLRLGEAEGLLIAPDDGEVAELRASPGEAIGPGASPLALVDAAGRFDVPLRFRPTTPLRLARKPVAPGDRVSAGDALAEFDAGGRMLRLLADRAGVVARFEASEGDLVEPGAAPVVLHVAGFDQKAHGLTGLWYGIAALMFGALAAAAVLPLDALGEGTAARRLGEVTRLRRFWVLVAVTCSINVCWHFLVNWLPTFLQTDRGMTYLAGGLFSALPFLAADFGNLGGGAASRALAGRGMEPARARLTVMAGCAVLVGAGAGIGLVGTGRAADAVVLGLLAVMALGIAAFMANYFAFCQEVAPAHTGLIVGYLGGLGNLLAAGFFPVVGRIKDQTGSFAPVFLLVGLLPFAGVAALALGWGRGESGRRSA